MPETMRVVAFVEAPSGGGRGRRLYLAHGVLHALDRRRADRHLGNVPEFPGEAFRAKEWLRLDEAAGRLLHLDREASGGPTGCRPFGQAGQRIAVAEALDSAGRGRRRASLRVDLRGTPGWLTLGQLYQGRFLGGRQPIGGALGPRAVIRQGTLERRECAAAPFI